MPRRRLGVVLPVPVPVAHEVDGLRRACGDGMLARVQPHLTLVPPVNIREGELGRALGVVRAAAAEIGRPITVGLGPVRSFAPVSPTVYLAVTGDAAAVVTRLRDAVFRAPLARTVSHPFVPHVTLADEIDGTRIDAAVTALADYRVTVTFDRVHVLEEGPGRVWSPIAEARLEGARIVGRGGLPLELSVSDVVDPEAGAVLAAEDDAAVGEPPADAVPLVVTARIDGAVCGVLRAWTAGGRGEVLQVALAGDTGVDVGHHLRETARSVAADRGCILD